MDGNALLVVPQPVPQPAVTRVAAVPVHPRSATAPAKPLPVPRPRVQPVESARPG